MATINELSDSFKDLASLQQFSIAQQKTIQEMQKTVRLLEEENSHLKMLLESSVPLISEGDLIVSDEESIARIQLKKIKENSFSRELTIDEARRVEIYTKIIHLFKDKDNKNNGMKEIKQSPDDKLLEMLNGDGK